MARVTAEQYAEKWSRRLSQATEDIRRGVDNVKVAPGVEAAKAKDVALQKIIQAFQDGTWEAQLRKVSLDDWKRATLEKGAQRITQGVNMAKDSQAAMARTLLAAVDASNQIVDQTPRGDLEANINRMVTFSREMAKRKLRRPGGG